MDPRYMDFGEVDSLALHPYIIKRVVEEEWILIYLGWLMSLVEAVAWLGGECSLAAYC